MINNVLEAGCDEAGRGPLAGRVYAAAVILPPEATLVRNSKKHNIEGYNSWLDLLNDSKQLTEHQRNMLRPIIEAEALAWAVSWAEPQEIDTINILNASILSMQRALSQLEPQPQHIIIDGNRFKPYDFIPYQTVVKGDSKYMSIAAASVLAKTYRDEYMLRINEEYPNYGWNHNMGYPTKEHREAVRKYGLTPYHRKTFRM